MLNIAVDGLHGSFLTTDGNGQQLFAVTTSGLTLVQLANVPLGIGTLARSSGPASGGTSVSVRGRGFKTGITATSGSKSMAVTFKDTNTLTFTTLALSAGSQQLVLTNPDGESVPLDAAFAAQRGSRLFAKITPEAPAFSGKPTPADNPPASSVPSV